MATPVDPSPAELIAEGITRISESMSQLLAAGLRKKTICVLVHSKTGIPQRDIAAVIESLNELALDWLEK